MSLQEFGQFIKNVGSTPETHCVICWYSYADYVTFHQAILGHSMLFDSSPTFSLASLKTSTGQNCLPPSHLGHIIGQCSKLMSTKLGYAYEAIFGRTYMEWHLPENDC